MAQIVKTLNYTGTRQELVWPSGWRSTLTAYLWGGGGGGGGSDAGVAGGNGTGGGFSQKTFTVNGGDVIEISVGGAGGGGNTGNYANGGSAGAGLIAGDSFSAISYSGGYGGRSGPRGYSGAGGGSGGATVLRVNGIVLAVAGGGAGGGGAGVTGFGFGSAPGPNLNDASTAGQNGGNQPYDGGGGGAGGGGAQGGNAGYWGGGSATQPYNFFDAIGEGGMFGTSVGDVSLNPSGINPGNIGGSYYSGNVGFGGIGGSGGGDGNSGQNGYAVVELAPNKLYVRNGVGWNLVNTVWVNNNGVWQSVQQVWIKRNGIWQPTLHSSAPNFVTAPSDFGVIARPAPTLQPAPAGDGSGSDPGGSGVSIF